MIEKEKGVDPIDDLRESIRDGGGGKPPAKPRERDERAWGEGPRQFLELVARTANSNTEFVRATANALEQQLVEANGRVDAVAQGHCVTTGILFQRVEALEARIAVLEAKLRRLAE
jgi:hypothetical protein